MEGPGHDAMAGAAQHPTLELLRLLLYSCPPVSALRPSVGANEIRGWVGVWFVGRSERRA